MVDRKMVYAPILIPTLCRDKHFINGIESLKKNSWARFTDVYIALDFPKEEKHFEEYKKICEYVENTDFSCFNSFNVIKRDKNMGAFYNMTMLIDDIKEKYDRWILAEDDIVFSPNFLEYMDKCLFEYEKNDDVLAINGYSYPLDYFVDEGTTVFRQSLYFNAWGSGFWREKYLKIERDLSNNFLFSEFDDAVRRMQRKSWLQRIKCYYVNFMLFNELKDYYKIMTDVAISSYVCLTQKSVIIPLISKTKNTGHDGSGLNCKKISRYSNKCSDEYDYLNQKIDENPTFELVSSKNNYGEKNFKILNNFMKVSKKRLIKTEIMIFIYKNLGKKSTKELLSICKRIKNNIIR